MGSATRCSCAADLVVGQAAAVPAGFEVDGMVEIAWWVMESHYSTRVVGDVGKAWAHSQIAAGRAVAGRGRGYRKVFVSASLAEAVAVVIAVASRTCHRVVVSPARRSRG